jgi:hypothetical protein
LFTAWKAGAAVDTKMDGLSTVKDVVRGMVTCGDEDQMLRFIEGVRAWKSRTSRTTSQSSDQRTTAASA